MIYPHDRHILRLGVGGEEDLPEQVSGFSPAIQQRLRRAFTPKGMEFFNFYGLLKSINQGYPVPDDLRMQFRKVTNRLNQVTSPVDGKNVSPIITNQIAEITSVLNQYLNRLTQQGRLSSAHWRMLNEIMVPLLITVARDKEVYLKAMQRGLEQWAIFHPLTGKQEQHEKMRDTDPETYALVERYRTTLKDIDQAITETIQDNGLVAQEGFMMGRPVIYGVDPKTGEKMVYDRDGDILTPDEYKDKRRAKAKADTRLALVSTRTDVPLKKMRMLTDGEVDALTGDVEWSALTDDLAKQSKTTRIFPTKKMDFPIQDEEGNIIRYEGIKVIVGGRYKGTFLDDMVNGLGRMIEGTSYTYSPLTGRKGMAPKRIKPEQREPYVTVADMTETMVLRGKKVKKKTKKLFMRISNERAFNEIKYALRDMACSFEGYKDRKPKGTCIQSISYHKDTKGQGAGIYFDPKDFASVMDVASGVSLSTAALEVMERYNKEQAYADKALTDENLKYYSTEAIGGFKSRVKLLGKQKQALAWLEANGGSGVCALDTGLGKTICSIAMMQKQLRDGMAEEGASYTTPDGEEVKTNGRFLYVCPNSLRGNLPSQIRKFMEDPHLLGDRVDTLTYAQFGTAQMRGKIPKSLANKPFWKGRTKFDAKYYISIYFDEAHNLRGTNQASKGALKLWHPRKVCMTASPMDKEPMEAYVLAAVSNNTRTFRLPGDTNAQIQAVREAQATKRRFKKRYCETVGGDVVGVKEDPSIKRELDQWVKRNVFYAEKTAVEEFELKEPTRTPLAVEMNPMVEKAYSALTSQFSRTFLGVAKKWKARGGPGTSGADVKRFAQREFQPVIRLMKDLSNRPSKALEDIATMIDTNKMPDGKNIPAILRRVVAQWSSAVSGNELRQVAQGIVNPKLDVAEQIITAKLSETERGPNPSRAILFADDPDFCMDAVKFLGQKMGGKTALALKDTILIFQGSTPLKQVVFERSPGMIDRLTDPSWRAEFEKTGDVSVIPLPLRKKAYKRHPGVGKNNTDNKYYKPDDWQQFAFQEVIGPDQGIKAVVLLGSEYSYGHNLQMFDTVIHLDRDGGKSETMKQRTARAWRQGQKNPVEEYTLDATYSAQEPDGKLRDEHDLTLDQIDAARQAVGKDVFDKIMLESMSTDLGGKWDKMVRQNASLANMDRKVMELMLSPYVGRSDAPVV